MNRQIAKDAKRWVVKIGSALLTNNGAGLDRDAIDGWVHQIAELMAQGKEVVLVSSGAIAEGIVRLQWQQRPESIHELQAAAAVGQMGLIQAYESSFQRFDRHTAQILLDHDDMASRQRYLNARGVLQTLLSLNVVPIVNENDTVVTDEIRFGDNDSLAALVANLIDADMLVILTDKDGLYSANPDTDINATLITNAMATDSSLDGLAGGSSGTLGRGGMVTKLQAARLAARSGCNTVIAGGRNQNILHAIAAGDEVGTLLSADCKPLAARKQWLAGHLQIKGQLVLDAGAVQVLTKQGRSLLAVGVSRVVGTFTRGDLVSCVDSDGTEIARGLVNYNSDEASRIRGQSTDSIASILGYREDEELIHRDNLVVSAQ
ncbi:MAG: glutamate 5-kinase [Porticoccaceae bacterium]|jgi:glutamate 5-kinase|nr:glutamate 5-kinase [Porticoccaceae bacterium]MDG1308338.1 glutamate 5-kinase [Porticoccaceae bacterium]